MVPVNIDFHTEKNLSENMVLVNTDFHTEKKLAQNYLQCGQAPSVMLAIPIKDRKSLNIGLKRRETISLPEAPTRIRTSLFSNQVLRIIRIGTVLG